MEKFKQSVNTYIRAIFKLFQAVNFSRNLNFAREAKIGIFYSLSDLQISDFQEAIQHHNFKTNFNINSIKNLQVFVLNSNANTFIAREGFIIIQTISPSLTLLINLIKNKFDYIYQLQDLKKKIEFKEEYLKLSKRKKILLSVYNSYSNLSLFTTISTLGKNPELFSFHRKIRGFDLNLLHYSQNTLPIDLNYKFLKTQIADYLTDDNIDTHYVWSREYADVLSQKKSETKYEAVGPILFKLNHLDNFSSSKKKSIVIFDVTISNFKEHQKFYSEDVGLNFLKDVTEVVNLHFLEIECNLFLKPKRPYNEKIHSKKYLDKIFDYADKKKLTLYKSEFDIFELLRDTKLSISVPFTTAAILSREMGIPSIYYFPFANNILTNIHEKSIPLIVGKIKLERYLKENFPLNLI